MTATIEQTKSVSWKCPACRAKGSVTATNSAIDQAIATAHHDKQPTCTGIPSTTEPAA